MLRIHPMFVYGTAAALLLGYKIRPDFHPATTLASRVHALALLAVALAAFQSLWMACSKTLLKERISASKRACTFLAVGYLFLSFLYRALFTKDSPISSSSLQWALEFGAMGTLLKLQSFCLNRHYLPPLPEATDRKTRKRIAKQSVTS